MKFKPGAMLPDDRDGSRDREAVNLPDAKRLVHLQFRGPPCCLVWWARGAYFPVRTFHHELGHWRASSDLVWWPFGDYWWEGRVADSLSGSRASSPDFLGPAMG
jgi:hypothetical protein